MKIMMRALCFVLFLMGTTASGHALELIYVASKSCTYCAKFNREVAAEYSATGEGRVAPMRRVSAFKKWPEDLAGIKQTPFTPAFIVVSNGREVGRFYGYVGRNEFYSRLDSLIQ